MINNTAPIVSYRIVKYNNRSLQEAKISRNVLNMTKVINHITVDSLFLLIIQTIIKAYFNKLSLPY